MEFNSLELNNLESYAKILLRFFWESPLDRINRQVHFEVPLFLRSFSRRSAQFVVTVTILQWQSFFYMNYVGPKRGQPESLAANVEWEGLVLHISCTLAPTPIFRIQDNPTSEIHNDNHNRSSVLYCAIRGD